MSAMSSDSHREPRQHDLAGERLAEAKRIGEAVERRVARRIDGLGLVPDDVAHWFDAVATRCLDPTDVPLVGLCLVERGTRLEVKAALRWYSSGHGQRGRFSIRRGQHERLLDAAASYLFVVRNEADRPLAVKVVPASIVEDLLTESWVNAGDGREAYQQVGWGRFFDPTEVDD